MAISKRKNEVEVKNGNFWTSLGLSDDLLEFETPIKKSRQDDRLIRTVGRVDNKLDSLEESLARREEETRFAEDFLNSLLGDSEATSSKSNEYALEHARFYCNYCNFSFSDGSNLMAHMLERHVTAQKKRFYCHECGEEFEELKVLQNHVANHCNSNSCHLCKSSVGNSHSVEEIARLKLICDFCSYTDTLVPSYQIHCLVCSNNPSNENYKPTNEGRVCSICSQVFNSNIYLIKHINQKHNKATNQDELVKKFACEDCGRRFISNASLAGHKKIHKKTEHVSSTVQFVRPEQRLNGVLTKTKPKPKSRAPVFDNIDHGPVEDMPDLF